MGAKLLFELNSIATLRCQLNKKDQINNHPTHLFCPTCLIGTWECLDPTFCGLNNSFLSGVLWKPLFLADITEVKIRLSRCYVPLHSGSWNVQSLPAKVAKIIEEERRKVQLLFIKIELGLSQLWLPFHCQRSSDKVTPRALMHIKGQTPKTPSIVLKYRHQA